MATEKAFTSASECPPLPKDKVRIYSMRFCPFAQRTRLVLAHKNIPNECINIHLDDKPTWFLEKWDAGTVPVIEIGDKVIPESLIASEYLDEIYPVPKLMPSDPYIKAKHNVLIERFGKIISKFYKKWREELEEDLFADLKYFDEELSVVKGKFFGGEQPCFLDMMIWPWCERFEIFPDFAEAKDRFPKFEAWRERMKELPAVQKELHSVESYIGFYTSVDYDYGL